MKVVLDPKFANEHGHFCNKSICATYPFQTCSFICGVVAIVVSAIACLAKSFFEHIIKVQYNETSRHVSNLYIQKPTKCSKFLRCAVMAWMSADFIDIGFVVPSAFLQSYDEVIEQEIESDSDEDENIHRLQSQPTSENQDTKNINVPATSAIKEEKTDTKSVKAEADQSMNATPPAYQTEESTTIHDRKEKDDPTNAKPDQKFDISRNVKPSDMKNTEYKCTICNKLFARGFTRRQHIQSHHRDSQSAQREAQTGNCHCLECGYKCRRIIDLRQHLSRVHNKIFRIEDLHFDSIKGG